MCKDTACRPAAAWCRGGRERNRAGCAAPAAAALAARGPSAALSRLIEPQTVAKASGKGPTEGVHVRTANKWRRPPPWAGPASPTASPVPSCLLQSAAVDRPDAARLQRLRAVVGLSGFAQHGHGHKQHGEGLKARQGAPGPPSWPWSGRVARHRYDRPDVGRSTCGRLRAASGLRCQCTQRGCTNEPANASVRAFVDAAQRTRGVYTSKHYARRFPDRQLALAGPAALSVAAGLLPAHRRPVWQAGPGRRRRPPAARIMHDHVDARLYGPLPHPTPQANAGWPEGRLEYKVPAGARGPLRPGTALDMAWTGWPPSRVGRTAQPADARAATAALVLCR